MVLHPSLLSESQRVDAAVQSGDVVPARLAVLICEPLEDPA